MKCVLIEHLCFTLRYILCSKAKTLLLVNGHLSALMYMRQLNT